MNEEIIFIGSILAGSLLTVAIDKIMKPAFTRENKNDPASYESVRTELNSLEFEKNLVAESAFKVNEAFEEKRIDVYERDKLLQQYTKQIEQYEERIEKYQSMLDFADLRNQRDNLADMLNKRIASIDQRLKEIHNRFNITYESIDGDRIEKALENSVQKNLQDSKQIDELTQTTTRFSPSTRTQSQELVYDQLETKGIEDLQEQIMLELDKLEESERKEGGNADNTKKLQVSSASVELQGDTKLAVGNDKGMTRIKRDALAFLEGLHAEEK